MDCYPSDTFNHQTCGVDLLLSDGEQGMGGARGASRSSPAAKTNHEKSVTQFHLPLRGRCTEPVPIEAVINRSDTPMTRSSGGSDHMSARSEQSDDLPPDLRFRGPTPFTIRKVIVLLQLPAASQRRI